MDSGDGKDYREKVASKGSYVLIASLPTGEWIAEASVSFPGITATAETPNLAFEALVDKLVYHLKAQTLPTPRLSH